MAPDGAKMVQDEAKMAQDGARMAQDVGQTSPEESRQQNKNKSIHPNSRSSSFAGSISYILYIVCTLYIIDIVSIMYIIYIIPQTVLALRGSYLGSR